MNNRFKYYKAGSDILSIATNANAANEILIDDGVPAGAYSNFEFEIKGLTLTDDHNSTTFLMTDMNPIGYCFGMPTPQGASRGTLLVRLNTGGGDTMLYSFANCVQKYNTAFDLKIAKNGTTLRVYINGHLMHTVSAGSSYYIAPKSLFYKFKGSFLSASLTETAGEVFTIQMNSAGTFVDTTGNFTPTSAYTYWKSTSFTVDISNSILNKPNFDKSIQGAGKYFFNSESGLSMLVSNTETFTDKEFISVYRNNASNQFLETELIFYGRIDIFTKLENAKKKVYTITAQPMTASFKTDYTINQGKYTLEELLVALRAALGTGWSIVTPFTAGLGVPLLNEEYLMTGQNVINPNDADSELRKDTIHDKIECFSFGETILPWDDSIACGVYYWWKGTAYITTQLGKEPPTPNTILERYSEFRAYLANLGLFFPALAQIDSPDYVTNPTNNSGYLKYDKKIFVFGKEDKQYGFRYNEVDTVDTESTGQYTKFDTFYLVNGESSQKYNWYYYADEATEKIYAVNRYIPIVPDTRFCYGQVIDVDNMGTAVQEQIAIAGILSDIAKLSNTKIRITEKKVEFLDMASEDATVYAGTLIEHLTAYEYYDATAFELNLTVDEDESENLNVAEAEKYYNDVLGYRGKPVVVHNLTFYDMPVVPLLGKRLQHNGKVFGIVTNISFNESEPNLIYITTNEDY